MGSAKPQTKKQLLTDIASLAAYAPRAKAIGWIYEGQFERYIDWAWAEGYEAAKGMPHSPMDEGQRYLALTQPMALDSHLLYAKIMAANVAAEQALSQMAFERIHLFGQSPLEMLLRSGSDQVFDALLRFLTSPKARFALGMRFGALLKLAWGTWEMRLSSGGMESGRFAWKHDSEFLILPFAVMIGRRDRADLMLKRGLQPSDWHRTDSDVGALHGLPHDTLVSLTGVEKPDLSAASDWIRKKYDLSEKLSELDASSAASTESLVTARNEAMSIAEEGVAISYYPMAIASEAGDVELLKCFFANGGDPNCYYKTGSPMLARFDASKLDANVLQTWLDAGANPATSVGGESVFGGSAIENFVYKDRLDLVKKSYEGAVGKFDLRTNREGKSYASLLAVALSHGNRDMALWLIRQGCKLSDRDESTDKPCSTFGDAMLIADLKSELEHKVLRVSTPQAQAADPKKTMKDRTDTL